MHHPSLITQKGWHLRQSGNLKHKWYQPGKWQHQFFKWNLFNKNEGNGPSTKIWQQVQWTTTIRQQVEGSHKEKQLTKIMSSLYAKCINTVNQQAQGEATARAFNNLILSMSTSITTGLLEAINMDAVKWSCEQLLHAMQVRFQKLCVTARQVYKDGIGGNKGNGSKVTLDNIYFKGTCYHCNK